MSVDLSIVDDACAEAFGEAVTIPSLSPDPVVAIVRRGTRRDVLGSGAGDFASPAWVMEIRKSVWPSPAKGSAVTLVDGDFVVGARPDQDDAGTAWIIDLKKL
ncbi:hypothetical protein FHP25_24985 [Vineibacter terrae]|uniref:Uncharacterized protein n=1 Tax=Vineibacter terrae TaxID=2586908 RepID=A0A5C8PGY3_9HYPH|nr:hypothetical protein [Vineibacter terrae]TXL72554.1 hypothetical protein FHP25_24985 [Vineibacter terrae]